MHEYEEDIGHILKLLNDKLKIKADESLKKTGLTISQTRVMQFVQEQGGKTTQKEIEEYLNVSHPTVVGIVSRMEKNGFLSCYMDTTDRRNKIVSATPMADELGDAMEREMKIMEQSLLQGLSEAEVNELRRMLLILYRNVD